METEDGREFGLDTSPSETKNGDLCLVRYTDEGGEVVDALRIYRRIDDSILLTPPGSEIGVVLPASRVEVVGVVLYELVKPKIGAP